MRVSVIRIWIKAWACFNRSRKRYRSGCRVMADAGMRSETVCGGNNGDHRAEVFLG